MSENPQPIDHSLWTLDCELDHWIDNMAIWVYVSQYEDHR